MPRKMFEFAQVFCLKVVEELLFKFPNAILIIACYNNVIHINNQVNALPRRGMMKEN